MSQSGEQRGLIPAYETGTSKEVLKSDCSKHLKLQQDLLSLMTGTASTRSGNLGQFLASVYLKHIEINVLTSCLTI